MLSLQIGTSSSTLCAYCLYFNGQVTFNFVWSVQCHGNALSVNHKNGLCRIRTVLPVERANGASLSMYNSSVPKLSLVTPQLLAAF